MLSPKTRALAKQDEATVDPDGKLLQSLISGVIIQDRPPIEDPRGSITEAYNPSWGLDDQPIAYVYQVILRPGSVRGWVVHEHQLDRCFHSTGVVRWALFDSREDSLTYGKLTTHTFSEQRRVLMIIPPGVWHAVKSIGQTDALFINMPSVLYNYAAPDKHRISMPNELTDFTF